MEENKKAFTLAEVLITLTIIGVIAAITIPNLMQTWRKHERITQIKTAYSIIQNATKMAVSEHGNPDGWDISEAGNYAPKYFIPYVKVQKLCGAGNQSYYFLSKGCFKDSVNGNTYNNGVWYQLNGNLYNTSAGGYGSPNFYTLILQNGMHVAIWAPWKNAPTWAQYIYFFVDVDGRRGTTTLGKDIFTFTYNLNTGKFSTGGNTNNYSQSDCTLTGVGASCAYWIERNHWEFPDNYPVKKF